MYALSLSLLGVAAARGGITPYPPPVLSDCLGLKGFSACRIERRRIRTGLSIRSTPEIRSEILCPDNAAGAMKSTPGLFPRYTRTPVLCISGKTCS